MANAGHEDLILAQITSRPYADPNAIEIRDQDFLSGSLQVTSYVRTGKLFTASQNLIKAEVGRLKPEMFSKIIRGVVAIFNSTMAV